LVPDIVLDKRGYKGDPGPRGVQGPKGYKGIQRLFLSKDYLHFFRFIGNEGEPGPLGFEGPPGVRGILGEVIQVKN
jgi:hypothetical protein